MEVNFKVGESVRLVRVFEVSFDVVFELSLELLLLFMLLDLVMFMFFFFSCRFDVHVLLFWVCSLILDLMFVGFIS